MHVNLRDFVSVSLNSFQPETKYTDSCYLLTISVFWEVSECRPLYALSRVSVTKTRVWNGESVYWIFTSRNYN
jgi:hypothetical protein